MFGYRNQRINLVQALGMSGGRHLPPEIMKNAARVLQSFAYIHSMNHRVPSAYE
jgi:hypothetical protein